MKGNSSNPNSWGAACKKGEKTVPFLQLWQHSLDILQETVYRMPWCLTPTLYECSIQHDSSLLILSLLNILNNQRLEDLNSPSQKLTVQMSLTFKEATKWEFRLNEMIWYLGWKRSFSANSNQTWFQLYNQLNLRVSTQQADQRFNTNKWPTASTQK